MKASTLIINNLHASVADKAILQGVSLTVESSSVHAIMGPNGGGKSTLAYVVMGHPAYSIVPSQKTKISIDSTDLIPLSPEDRARAGLFLAFQSPVAIPGVSVVNLLRTAYQELYRTDDGNTGVANPALARRWQAGGITLSEFMGQIKDASELLRMDKHFLERGIHDGFSGGEKKKLEMLQALVLKPKFAFFDEIDTGLDVDALRLVAAGISELKKGGTGVVVITHYQRILQYLEPDFVHVFVDGRIVKSGDARLAGTIEKEGYKDYVKDPKSH